MRIRAAAVCALIMWIAAPASAAAAGVQGAGAPSPCELFLAAAIAGMMACSLASFFLAGRVTERTHVALALFVVLIGAFCLLILLGLFAGTVQAIGAFVLLGLAGLFKLMNQFEIRRRPGHIASGQAPRKPR